MSRWVRWVNVESIHDVEDRLADGKLHSELEDAQAEANGTGLRPIRVLFEINVVSLKEEDKLS